MRDLGQISKLLFHTGILSLFLFLGTGCQNSSSDTSSGRTGAPSGESDALRIVSLSGYITEILFDLDLGAQIVGVDVTSTYPEEVKNIQKLGHVSQLNIEGILGTKPDIIFVQTDQANQSKALDQLKNSNVPVVLIPANFDIKSSVKAAEEIARHVPVNPEALQRLEQQIDRDQKNLEAFLQDRGAAPGVLFIYARSGGSPMVAGKGTAAQAIIEEAGGRNAVHSFSQYKALTPESLIGAEPDYILMFDSGLENLDGKEGLASIPGMKQTPAFRHDRIITMDGHYLTSFGPRAARAALDLARKLYPDSK